MEVSKTMIGLITLIIGFILGYMGQRSRFCTISGIRDFFLVRDAYRLKGVLGVFAGGVFGFSVFGLIGGDFPGFPLLSDGWFIKPAVLMPLSAIGVFGMGFFSVWGEGCPFRQHVMAGEGRISGLMWLAGMIVGVIFFSVVIVPYLQLLTLLG
jgi:uncharacterized membrane protein YedE/YeeE